MNTIKELIKTLISRFKNSITELPSNKPNPFHPWDEDDNFKALINQIIGFTLVDKIRCFMIYQFATHCAALPGDVAEVGVYKGGTARLLAKTLKSKSKTIHLFDTFFGMPPSDPNKDIHKQGDFNDTSLEHVKTYLSDCGNVRFYQGLFPITAVPVENKTFCFVHVDTDIYKSTIDCCTFFYPRMQKGGIIIFDDYGFLSCPGAKMAVDEFFADKIENPCYLPTGQCIVTRL